MPELPSILSACVLRSCCAPNSSPWGPHFARTHSVSIPSRFHKQLSRHIASTALPTELPSPCPCPTTTMQSRQPFAV